MTFNYIFYLKVTYNHALQNYRIHPFKHANSTSHNYQINKTLTCGYFDTEPTFWHHSLRCHTLPHALRSDIKHTRLLLSDPSTSILCNVPNLNQQIQSGIKPISTPVLPLPRMHHRRVVLHIKITHQPSSCIPKPTAVRHILVSL